MSVLGRIFVGLVVFGRLSMAQTAWTNLYPNNFDIAFGNGVYVMVGDVRRYSADGITWTQIPGASSSVWRAVAFGNGKFIALQQHGEAAVSINGIDWEDIDLRPLLYSTTGFQKVAFVRGAFYVLSEGILRSVDLLNWTVHVPRSPKFDSIADSGARIVALGEKAAISPSGENGWTLQQPSVQGLYRAVYFDGKFRAVRLLYNTIHTSVDGVNWSTSSELPDGFHGPLSSCQMSAIANELYLSNSGGRLIVSSDGTTWMPLVSPTTHSLSQVYRANGRFLVPGVRNTLLSSPDGRAWASMLPQSPHRGSLFSAADGGQVQVITGRNGLILQRQNGAQWEAVATHATHIASVAHHNGNFYHVSTNVTISADGRVWAPDESSRKESYLRIKSLNNTLGRQRLGWSRPPQISCDLAPRRCKHESGPLWPGLRQWPLPDLRRQNNRHRSSPRRRTCKPRRSPRPLFLARSHQLDARPHEHARVLRRRVRQRPFRPRRQRRQSPLVRRRDHMDPGANAHPCRTPRRHFRLRPLRRRRPPRSRPNVGKWRRLDNDPLRHLRMAQ